MAKIHVNTNGISALGSQISSVRKEADQCVRAISAASNLDSQIAAAEGIERKLRDLKKRMQAQEEKLERYTAFLNRVNDEFSGTDRQLADQSKELRYLMDSIVRAMAVTAPTRSGLDVSGKLWDVRNLHTLFTQWADGSSWDVTQRLWEDKDRTDVSGLAHAAIEQIKGGVELKDLSSLITPSALIGGIGGVGLGFLGGSAGIWWPKDNPNFSNYRTDQGNMVPLEVQVSNKVGTSLGKVKDAYNNAAKETGKHKSGWQKFKEGLADAGEAAGKSLKKAGDWVGDKAKDAFVAVYDFGVAAVDWAEEAAEDVVEFGKAAGDVVVDIVTSKPAEYLWEAGKDVFFVGVDIVSAPYVLMTDGIGGGVSLTMDLINGVFDTGQDLVAAGVHTIGYAFDGETQKEFFDAATEYSQRDGLAGELKASGLEGWGIFIDGVDTVNGIYKIAKGIKGVEDTYYAFKSENYDWKTIGDALGWKNPGAAADIWKYQKDYASNAKMVYKYAEGLLSGELGNTIFINSQGGKLISNVGKVLGKIFGIAEDIKGTS